MKKSNSKSTPFSVSSERLNSACSCALQWWKSHLSHNRMPCIEQNQPTAPSSSHDLTTQDPLTTRIQWLMAREQRAGAEGGQFRERWEAEYFSSECEEMYVCFMYHKPFQTGTSALSHRSEQRERERERGGMWSW